MRIIAGEFKGRTLASPTWEGLRPTSDSLRETLFNVLGPSVADASFLDGCAGTGAVGLEALSRGARHATFIDRDARAVRLLQQNAAHLGVENRCVIIRDTMASALAGTVAGAPFDIVVLDPPYAAPWIGEALHAAARHLASDGLLVLEHAARVSPPLEPRLVLVRTRRAGDSALSTYRRASAAEEEEAGPT